MGRSRAIDKQNAILLFIKQEVQRCGYPPSVREIGEAVGVMSTSTVHGHLEQLEKRGLIRRNPTKPRAIEIIDQDNTWLSAVKAVPLLGKVTAGQPITAYEDIEDYVAMPMHLNDEEDVFALRVLGDSMIEAGIHSGDIVYVKKTSSASSGEIIVAMTEEGEATVKRFFQEQGRVRLQPENASMQPLYYKSIIILGKVIGLWRTL
nr:transcriptional repressor LexA [Bacilli bacterium]